MSSPSSFGRAVRTVDPYLGHIAHLAPRSFLVVAASMVVAPWLSEPWRSLVGWPMAMLVVVSFLALGRHHFVPCLLCAAMTPLDGAAAVARREPLLRRFHRPRMRAAAGALLLGATAVPSLTLLWGLPPALTLLYIGVMYAIAAAAAHVFAVHTLLKPWCPYCRGWDKRGPREPSPHPAPMPENTPTGG